MLDIAVEFQEEGYFMATLIASAVIRGVHVIFIRDENGNITTYVVDDNF